MPIKLMSGKLKSQQVGWFTADSAAVNHTTIHEFEHQIDSADDGWTAQEHNILYVHLLVRAHPVHRNVIRCMEHALHVASKYFVEAVAPVLPTAIQKKIRVALAKAQDDGKLDLDDFNEALISIDLENVGEESEDDNTDFTPGDVLGKVLALVKQVLFSHIA